MDGARIATSSILAGLALASPALGTVEVYFDFAEWQAALPSFTTIDFTGFDKGDDIYDQYADQGVLFPGDNFILLSESNFPIDGSGLHTGTFTEEIEASFFEPQYALATHFTGAIQLFLFSRGQLVYESGFFGDGIGLFVGLVSTDPFDGAMLRDPTDPVGVIDNLYFGVPAPGALGFFALAGMSGPGRRRRG